MILPTSYGAVLALAILGFLLWGSWASAFKATGDKWRFELFYIDFALGVIVTATLCAFTLGMLGTELSFVDNIAVTGRRHLAFGVAAGGLFNLANMLLLASVSLVGMSVAFPVAFAAAIVVGALLSFPLAHSMNAAYLFGGIGILILSILTSASAHLSHRRNIAARTGKKVRRVWKGIIVGILSGVLMAGFAPILQLARVGDIGLGPYALAFCVAIGIVGSTVVYSIYFMNLPVHGEALEPMRYIKGPGKAHLLGLVGGAMWILGTISVYLVLSAPQGSQLNPAVTFFLANGGTVIAALWGVVVWKEFRESPGSVKTMIALSVLLFAGGLGMLCLTPAAQ